MAETRVIVSPFDCGLPDWGMGAGSTALAASGSLRSARVETVPAVEESTPELARVIELDRRLAGRVRAAREEGDFPLVLAGNCNSCLGTVSGLSPELLRRLRARHPHRHRIRGARPVDSRLRPGPRAARRARWRPRSRAVPAGSTGALRAATGVGGIRPSDLAPVLDGLRDEVDRVYLHIDLDALNEGEGRANRYAAPGGPSLDTRLAAVEQVFDRFEVLAAALTAYEPDADADGRARQAAEALIRRMRLRT